LVRNWTRGAGGEAAMTPSNSPEHAPSAPHEVRVALTLQVRPAAHEDVDAARERALRWLRLRMEAFGILPTEVQAAEVRLID
jgi:hypothetical protein